MKFTDQEIDSIALAIYNAAREAAAQPKVESLGAVHQPLPWRMAARAALAARDALFEVVGDTWAVRHDDGHDVERYPDKARARETADMFGASGGGPYHLVHVTTKRRKARVVG